MDKNPPLPFSWLAIQSIGASFGMLVIGSGLFGIAMHDLQVGLGIALGSLVLYGPVCVILLCTPLTLLFCVVSRSRPLSVVDFPALEACGGASLGCLGALVFGPGLRRYTSGMPNSVLELTPVGLAMGLAFGLIFA
jgi:hypothetical protein